MRTTVTLDDDVAVRVKRLLRERHARMKDIVNEAMRLGLQAMNEPPKKSRLFRTKATNLGRPLIDIDNVAEALAYAEGEDFK